MCRWIAYLGEPIFLEDILVKPSHSLLRQSRFAEENFIKNNLYIPDGAFPTNDDGFGIGWYGERSFPGVYKELRPAWNDKNYLTMAAQVRSRLFLAHLRAAYQGVVQRTNCHPFRHYQWLFQHNGEINGFSALKREIALAIDPKLFPYIDGTTDTEWFFNLAITYGLCDNPKNGLQCAINFVEDIKVKYGITAVFKLTASFSDGDCLYAIRYATHGDEKTLYINKNNRALSDENNCVILPNNSKLLVSEPLSDMRGNWEVIPKHHFVTITQKGNVSVEPLTI
ncbi:MAG: class II glutamine amidotransferase [Ostreibacterium sp.]